METPHELESIAKDHESIAISKHEYEEESVLAVDFGPTVRELSLDVVDNTAIVVVDDEQFEFEVPPDANDVTVNDGILTITA